MSFSDNKNELTLKSELRHLSIKDRLELCNILDINDNWKRLASIIPKPDESKGYLISSNNINVLEELQKRGKSPTQALLDFWGTSGRNRAKIEDLVQLLNNCHLYRASLFISNDLLHIQSLETLFDDKIGLNNDFNDVSNYDLLKDCNNSDSNSSDEWNNLSTKLLEKCSLKATNLENKCISPSAPNESQLSFDSSDENIEQITHFSYNDIRIATKNFSEISVSNGGQKLGEGAFGSVFLCQFNTNSNYYAVKKLKNDFQKQFLSELKVMNKFKHKNLLSLCGISSDGPSLCIVYEYMSNGSLQDCIANHEKPLSWQQRIEISIGTARGICHLHTFADKPYVHRDIKSANILLDNDFTARVGDFGLVRIGSSGVSTATKPLATTIIGTTVYMAPEAFRGDISVKLDSFSFGVVLLELLTGLLPYDQNRDEYDLLSYLEEMVNDFEEDDSIVVNNLIDRKAGDWDHNIALQLLQISRKCTEQRKKFRPNMIEVLELLEKMSSLSV